MPSNPRQKRKLRAGHTKRQSKKQARKKQQHKRESKVQVVNPLIAKQWDKKKTLNENFRALGLILDPNNDVAGDKSRFTTRGGGVTNSEKPKSISTVVQGIDDPKAAPSDCLAPMRSYAELERIAAERADKTYKVFCSRGEVIFIQECIRKYGMDFVKMAKDIKLNTYQHTPKQLENKVKKYVDTIANYCPAESLEELAKAIAQAEDKTRLFLEENED
eukprot:TRINITY_DN9049_c0_g2_i4.p1 TRINITY_DN9049_c0_g2~~TRINITY_DN9049_c0_g2_i4.p1  ORF type:complete len:218 (+),score=25.52 TRINITY_DN9049_c0_g2_i4:51-704(+)